MKLSTWNVNGVRAAMNKGLRDYLCGCDADVICLQETRCDHHQAGLDCLKGYREVWNPALKKGYAGTAILTRLPFKKETLGMGLKKHDSEGRIITLEFPEFFVVNVYTPNARAELARLPYRMQWDEDFQLFLKKLEKKKPVLSCGDFNVAHQEIDIARPKDNRRSPGFTDEERAGFSKLIDSGFIDVFRHFDPRPQQYSWWSMRSGARARNVGWRIDYWLASEALRSRLKSSRIRQDVFGSDHCPVEMELH